MKKYLILLFIIFQCKKFDSQFVSDNFTAISGASQWFKAFGGVNMGVDGGTYLCYNIASSYANNLNNSFESPDYSSDIATSNCNTTTVSFSAAGSIRNSDAFVFCTYNGTWACYTVNLNASFTTYNITLSKTNYKFSFDLYTGSTGNAVGRYVHIDWFKISCATLLNVNIIDFKAEEGNVISWTLVSEVFSSELKLERSINGSDWLNIYDNKNAYNESFDDYNYNADTINYYRLSLFLDGNAQYSDIVAVNNKRKIRIVVGLFNSLGESVRDDYKGLVIEVYSDGFIKKLIK